MISINYIAGNYIKYESIIKCMGLITKKYHELSNANMKLNLLGSFKHSSKKLDRNLDLYPYRKNQSSVKNIIKIQVIELISSQSKRIDKISNY